MDVAYKLAYLQNSIIIMNLHYFAMFFLILLHLIYNCGNLW